MIAGKRRRLGMTGTICRCRSLRARFEKEERRLEREREREKERSEREGNGERGRKRRRRVSRREIPKRHDNLVSQFRVPVRRLDLEEIIIMGTESRGREEGTEMPRSLIPCEKVNVSLRG